MIVNRSPTDWIVTVLAHTWDGRVVRKRVGASPHLSEAEARKNAIDSFRRSILTTDNEYGLPIGWHLPPGGVKVIDIHRRGEVVKVFAAGKYKELLARYKEPA